MRRISCMDETLSHNTSGMRKGTDDDGDDDDDGDGEADGDDGILQVGAAPLSTEYFSVAHGIMMHKIRLLLALSA